MNATITRVNEGSRTWDGPNGTIEFLSGTFEDGSDWSLGTKPDNTEKRRAELEALIGQAGEYELEAKPEYNGRAQWKLKSWPGKPAFGGGGGKPREKSAAELDSIARSVALKAAVATIAHIGGRIPEDPLRLADEYLAWLTSSSPASGHTESTAGTTPLPRGNTAVGPSPGTSSSGEVGTDTTPSVGRVTPPASPDAQREGVGTRVDATAYGEGVEASSPDPAPHEHDLHPLRSGSKILRCSVAGCGYTERRDA